MQCLCFAQYGRKEEERAVEPRTNIPGDAFFDDNSFYAHDFLAASSCPQCTIFIRYYRVPLKQQITPLRGRRPLQQTPRRNRAQYQLSQLSQL